MATETVLKDVTEVVLKGVTKAKGVAEGEALVSEMPLSWAPCSILNNGTIKMVGNPVSGQNVKGKIVIYPTVTGSTSGAFGLLFKVKGSQQGPAGLICENVHTIDVSGAIASSIPAVDGLEASALKSIKTGDWVRIEANEYGLPATVTVTPKGQPHSRTQVTPTAAKAVSKKSKNISIKLTEYEQEMLDGVHGEAKKLAMEGLVAFGEAVGAKEMVKLSFIHYIGCQKGLPKDSAEYQQFEWGQGLVLEPFWKLGAKVTADPHVVCSCDPFIVQIDAYEKEGTPWNNKYFKMSPTVHKAAKDGYNHMLETGWLPSYSCTPHFNSAFPIHGEYAASCESSCACYLNSILGVKTNRESAVAAPYATITGCIPKYGMLLDENRRAKVIYELDDDIKNNILDDPADWAALGGAIAKRANNRIPAVLNMPPRLMPSAAKALTACASPGMNDPLLHLIGITPGSATLEDAFGGKVPAGVERIHLTIADVKAMYAELRTAKTNKVNIVHMGCPLLIYEEVHQIAEAIKGKKVHKDVMLWVQTDTPTYFMAKHYGDAQIIEEAGGKIYHQTCWGMNALSVDWGSDFNVATNSFKQFKIFGGLGHGVIFASLPELINAAVTGEYVSTRWTKPLEFFKSSYNPSIEDIDEFKSGVLAAH